MIFTGIEEIIDTNTKVLFTLVDKICDKIVEAQKSCDKTIESIQKEQELLDKLKERNDRIF